MVVELVYRSSKGNDNYWAKSLHFTRKVEDHFQWKDKVELSTLLPKLVNDYPILFARKNNERFYIKDLSENTFESIDSQLLQESNNEEVEIDNQEDFNCPIKLTDRKYYAIAVDTRDGRYYFSTSKGKFIANLEDKSIRRWKELGKAAATANAIRTNKKIWNKYPEWNPLSDYVINLSTGKVVWPSNELKQGLVSIESNPNSINNALLIMMNDQLNTQLDTHFNSADELPTVDTKSQVVIPEIDLEKYSAKKVYDAFQFIVKALTQRTKVNQALKAYDGSILQDYLHTIEVVNLDDIEINKFTESLKQVRRKRRKIKNLALILNALADNMNAEKILKLLYQNPSLGNQYHYRDADTGNLLLSFINNEKFLTDIENK